MIGKLLLKFARQVVQTVISQLLQQANIVQDMAHKPMQAMVQQVVSGAWVGEGADAFVEEVSNIFMPRTTRISEQISKFNGDLQAAVDTIDRADAQVNNAVNGLADIFASVY